MNPDVSIFGFKQALNANLENEINTEHDKNNNTVISEIFVVKLLMIKQKKPEV